MNKQENKEAVFSFQVDDQVDLAAFCQLLWKHQLRHRVITNEQGRFLMVATSEHMVQVKKLYQDWSTMSSKDRASVLADGSAAWKARIAESAVNCPVTTLVSLITLVISGIMLLLNPGVVRWFSIAPPLESLTTLGFEPLSQTFATMQLWRLITPVFMHFSLLHLVFDLVIVIYLMRPLERRLGSGLILAGFLAIGICSNLVQYYFANAVLFGGLSGIAYGLVGFVLVMQWAFPDVSEWAGNRGFLIAMLVFLVLYSTGVTEIVDLHIANAAHWAGLVSGILLAGLMIVKLNRKKLHP